MKKLLFIFSVILSATLLWGCSEDKEVIEVYPTLTSIIPKTGYTGASAIVSGTNFSENPEENSVEINGQKAEILAATADRLCIVLPDNPKGEYSVKVSVRGKEVEGLKIGYVDAPAAPSLSVLQLMPSTCYQGDEVVIIGECFNPTANQNTVVINGVEIEPLEATANKIRFIVPQDMTPGKYPVTVKTADAEATGAVLTVLHLPVLTSSSLFPASGKVGSSVTVSGECFSETPEENVVKLGDVEATVTASSFNSLTFTVPQIDLGTYKVSITVDGKTVDNLEFTVVEAPWLVSTIAGTGARATTDGKGREAAFNLPDGIVLDPTGQFLVICDRNNHQLRKMDAEYNVTTWVKNNTDGVAFNAPWNGAFDSFGNFYLANKGKSNLVKVTPTGHPSVMVSNTTITNNAMGVALDKDENIYIAARDAKKVQKISKDGTLLQSFDMTDQSQGPTTVAVDAKGRVYAANGSSRRLFMFQPDGTRSVIAGSGSASADTWTDGEPGDPSTASFGQSQCIMIASNGVMYICDQQAAVIRTLTPDANGDYDKGTMKTIAGTPFQKGLADGPAMESKFTLPGGICLWGDKIFICEEGNSTIRVLYQDK